MSARYDLERRIADYYETEAAPAAPDWVLREALGTIDVTPQRRVFSRVPWRLPAMNNYARFASAAVAVVVIGVIGYALLGPGGPPDTGGIPTPSPTLMPSPSPTSSPPPALTESYTSAIHGYTISYPAGWTVREATASWTTGIPYQLSASLDVIATTGNRFLGVASQPLAGRSGDAWSDAIASNSDWGDACELTSGPVTVDGESGVIVTRCDGTPTALVAVADRGYLIVLYGIEEPETWFTEILATMQLDPASAVDASPSSSP
jgi:hypothetical protein